MRLNKKEAKVRRVIEELLLKLEFALITCPC
jgi:hypothetical protein